MSKMDINKIVGSVLIALLAAVAIGQIGNFVFEPEELEENVYSAGVESAGTGTDGTGDVATPGLDPISPLLAAADVEAGQAVARGCSGCHTLDEGGGAPVGPNLWNVVGRAQGAVEDFGYSDEMAALDGQWGYEELNAFLAGPQDYVAGTRMNFPGVAKAEDRADLIAYLRTLAGDPVALPAGGEAPGDEEVEEEAAEEEAAEEEVVEEAPTEEDVAEEEIAEDAPSDAALRAAVDDAAAGKQVAGQCQGCHSLDKDGGVRVGPPLYGIVGNDQAAADFSYSDALAGLGGAWTYEALDAFLTKPQDYAPGTNMTIPGVADEDDRANLIRYLRDNDDAPEALPGNP